MTNSTIAPVSDDEAWIRQAFGLSIPVAMAYGPLGIAFGVYLVDGGISWYWAPLSALLIFAGSIEFLAVSFILGGLSPAAVAWITLIVNFRHIFYGLTFPIGKLQNRSQRAYGIFALTDETYGIVCAGAGSNLSGRGITALQIISHFWWVGGAFLGAIVGNLLPPELTGFEFALTGMFMLLAIDALKRAPENRLIAFALISIAVAYSFEIIVMENSFLIAGTLAYVLLLTLSFYLQRSTTDTQNSDEKHCV